MIDEAKQQSQMVHGEQKKPDSPSPPPTLAQRFAVAIITGVLTTVITTIAVCGGGLKKNLSDGIQIGGFVGGLMAIAMLIVGPPKSVGVDETPTTLAQKFAVLGALNGKSFAEIKSVVGSPNSISNLPNGRVLRQWMERSIFTGVYHISIVFDRQGNFERIQSETAI